MTQLPDKIIDEMRVQAIQAIQEYCNQITVGSQSEDGEFIETMMPQMTIILVEAFRLLSVLAWYESGEEMTADSCTTLAMKCAIDVALPAAMGDIRRVKKWSKDGHPDVSESDDPFDMVANAIKEAQKHASD